MSEIWIPAAGGGADLDVVTAQAGDVLQDKVIVGPDGEPLTGTMPNRGNYNGSGNSKGNDTGNQRMWVKIPQGYYNENAQVFLSWADIRQMAGITADKIKKNVSIIGIMGTFEGYVAGPSDIYNQGAWGAGTKNYSIKNGTFQQTAMFPTGSTTSGGRTSFYLYFRKNCIGYAKMIVEGTGLASSSIKAGSFISRAGVHLGTDTKLIFDLSAGIAHLGEASFECDFACYKVTKIYLN